MKWIYIIGCILIAIIFYVLVIFLTILKIYT